MALMLTRAQLAHRYNRNERTIDRWVRDPKMNFPAPRVVGARSLLWPETVIEEWERALPMRSPRGEHTA
jgi:predicted DNA-binding transcriptional regulator AlpA